jgi:hypothetical protein
VTAVPTAPDVGVNAVTPGFTRNVVGLTAGPTSRVATTEPVTAGFGTIATISKLEVTLNAAVAPPNVTDVVPARS